MRRVAALCLALVATAVFAVAPAHAQPRAKPAPKEPPAQKEQPTPPPSAPDKPDGPAASSAEVLAVVAGGLTADQAAQRAAETSLSVRAAQADLGSLEAKSDVTRFAYIPRLDLLGMYERLSFLTPPEISPGVRADVFFNYWLAQGTVTVPLSDYFLRIPHNRNATARAEDAGAYDVATAKAKAYYDGKVAYYNWLRAKAAIAVAEQALAAAKAHLKDADVLFNVGKASKADSLRAQTLVATSSLLVEKAKVAEVLAERQLRVLIHARDEEALRPGEALDAQLPALSTDVKPLLDEAIANRPELKSLESSAESARSAANAARAGRIPTVTAFADLIYANPNQRVFPQRNEFFPTWDAGLKLTWSPNDFLTAGATSADAEARAASAEAKKAVQRDAVDVEVVGAIQDVLQADVSIQVTQQQLESASEGYRVARELFVNGRTTGTALIDSESSLTQARFDHLNARVDARIARTRLDRALGRFARVK